MKLRHYDHPGDVHFVTFVCHHRLPLLKYAAAANILLDHLDRWRLDYDVALIGYVVMPDHVHLVFQVHGDMKVGPAIGELKSKSARAIIEAMGDRLPLARMTVRRNGRPRRAFWQRRCYDYNCRSADDVRQKIRYCHRNPVYRGLVDAPLAWRYSSYNEWANEGSGPIPIDRSAVPAT